LSAALKMAAANSQTEVRPVLYREGLVQPNVEEADLSHKFAIGQTVHLASSNAHNAFPGDYEVCHLMPASDYQFEPRYRIRNVAERHDRVVTESDLTLAQATANL